MRARTPALSVEDQKAIDVLLDHAVLDPSTAKTTLTRVAPPVPQRRLIAVKKLLAQLAELPEIDPPADLVTRTLQKIDQHRARNIVHSIPAATNPVH